jgi:hypothetical protein
MPMLATEYDTMTLSRSDHNSLLGSNIALIGGEVVHLQSESALIVSVCPD